MANLSFADTREEIASLLEHSNKEFDKGHALTALSMLFEAQFALNVMVQNAMEEAIELPSGMTSTSHLVH